MKKKLPQTGERSAVIKKPSVVISPNLKKESIMLDRDGNQIDRRTKQVIKYND